MVSGDIAAPTAGILWAFTKTLHVLAGIAVWEIASHVSFDWSLLVGKSRRPWTFWIYLGCRLSSIIAIISGLGGFSARQDTSCKVWGLTAMLFLDIAFALAMLMVAFRIAAIWARNNYIMFLTALAWIAPIAIYLKNLVMPDAASGSSFAGCALTRSQALQMSIFTMLSSFILLFIMLLGLRRLRRASIFSLWNVLYRQGLIWLSFMVLAEVPVFTVVAIGKVGEPTYLLLQVPRVIITALGATRMYRALYNFRWRQRRGMAREALRFIHAQPEDPLLIPDPQRTAMLATPFSVQVHVTSERLHDEDGVRYSVARAL